MPRKRGPGGPWVTVRAHYGALPSLAGRDRRRAGESLPGWRVFKLAPAPGRTVPRTKKPPLAGRREAFPWPLFSGDPGDKLRLYYQGAPFGVPPPLTFRGEKKTKPNSRDWRENAEPCAIDGLPAALNHEPIAEQHRIS